MRSKIYQVDGSLELDLWRLLKGLYAIPRTIMGRGYEESLSLIGKICPIEKLSFPSGAKIESWTIPKQWRVNSATIESLDGKVVIDYSNNPMHLWQYSVSVDMEISRGDLEGFLTVSPGGYKSIPHVVTYYKKRWGFSLSQKQKEGLTEDRYRVKIDTEFINGELSIGQILIPGRSKKEIIIDAVLSCPALGNNLSGAVVATYLAQQLLKKESLYFSYRFLFTPETIGPLVLCNFNENLLNNVVGGYTLVNLADISYFNYKKSRHGNTVADIAMMHSLKWFEKKYKVKEYDVHTGSCGNEKAYNSLGCEIPIGALSRSVLGSYPEYDTSSDNLEFISKGKLFDSFKICIGAIEALERSQKYYHTFKGEPFLTGYGLLPKIEKDKDRIPYDYLMGFSSGKETVVEIANRANLCVDSFDEAVKQFLNVGLIK